MTTKKIEHIISPPPTHFVGDGFKVHNFIPGMPQLSMKRLSPFIMLDYNAPFYFSPSDKPRGVDVHPHRGFETVTIAYKGKVAHHDSAGNSGIISEGDVQWMTAASGILHKEYHEETFSKQGGDFQMVQLWVNLPAKFKMTPPKYQAIENNQIPNVELPNNAGSVEVIAGEYQTISGAASTFTPVNLLNAKLTAGGSAEFFFPAEYNTALLVIEGGITVNNSDPVSANHFVLFENKGESFSIKANEASVVLVLSGEPIAEPIATYGPFVMNTHQELVEAVEDFNNGKFGILED
jgi:quercetin 2,3-dioxygenase